MVLMVLTGRLDHWERDVVRTSAVFVRRFTAEQALAEALLNREV
jgi:hypothetical protein